MASKPDETREGVDLTNLDQPLFDGAGATKRDLVDHLDGMGDRMVAVLADRPLSVIRVHRGQEAFMQKNVPKYAPDFVRTTTMWAESSKRQVSYALCDDRRTLLWFANQRAIEYHPALVTANRPDHVTHLVLDLDPPEGTGFELVVRAARLVQRTLEDAGLAGAVKTSGAKGLHVFVPLADEVDPEQAAAATRALSARAAALDPEVATTEFVRDQRGLRVYVDPTRVGGATVAAAYSPRARPGVPVSFPVPWDALDDVQPSDFTVHDVVTQLAGADPWAESMPAPQALAEALVEEGRAIPVPRVAAMHEGKRRAKAKRAEDDAT